MRTYFERDMLEPEIWIHLRVHGSSEVMDFRLH
jgi:hypothetical protein